LESKIISEKLKILNKENDALRKVHHELHLTRGGKKNVSLLTAEFVNDNDAKSKQNVSVEETGFQTNHPKIT